MKLLIVDAHEISRKGIILSLSFENGFDEIREADNVEAALMLMKTLKPDVTIISLRLGKNEEGLSIIEKGKEEGINTRYIILTASHRVEDFMNARRLGINGYILKERPIGEISYAIKCVARGGYFFDGEIQSQEDNSQYTGLKKALTNREYEVLQALGKGLTNSQIAQKLFITESTVKKHIGNILAKLEFSNRTEAAIYAAKMWRRENERD